MKLPTETSRALKKPVLTATDAVAGVDDGDVVFVGGWGGVGVPGTLLAALAAAQARALVVVANNCGMGRQNDVGVLFAEHKVSKAITSFPAHPSAADFRRSLLEDGLELELVPQGTLVERIRCAGSGLGGFFTPTGAGTVVGDGKEQRVIDDRLHVLENPLWGDVALIHAHVGDEYGNLEYRYAAGAFNATMAMAADLVLVEVDELSPTPLPPSQVDTAGIFVDALIIADSLA